MPLVGALLPSSCMQIDFVCLRFNRKGLLGRQDQQSSPEWYHSNKRLDLTWSVGSTPQFNDILLIFLVRQDVRTSTSRPYAHHYASPIFFLTNCLHRLQLNLKPSHHRWNLKGPLSPPPRQLHFRSHSQRQTSRPVSSTQRPASPLS